MADETLDIDPNTFTLGELEEIEDITGQPAGELFSGSFTTKTIRAMVYIAKRRTDPEFTLEDSKNVRMSDLLGLGDVEVPPTGSSD